MTHPRTWSKVALTFALAMLVTGGAYTQAPLREAHPRDDFTVREAMVPMRDGVKLYTLILTPKRRRRAAADPARAHAVRRDARARRPRPRRGSRSRGTTGYAGGGYHLRRAGPAGALQVRGRLRHVPRAARRLQPHGHRRDHRRLGHDRLAREERAANNGKVGVWGTSYPGWLTLAALRDPHPALAAAVPFNPVVDVWKADDWFHWGAFRAAYAFDFIYSMETRKGASAPLPLRDARPLQLDARARAPPAKPRHAPRRAPRDVEAAHGVAELRALLARLRGRPLVRRADAAGADAARARPLGPGGHLRLAGRLRRARDARPRQRPELLRGGALVPRPALRGRQPPRRARASTRTPPSDSARTCSSRSCGGSSRARTSPAPAPVTVFETGTNRWRRFDRWPPAAETRRLYLQPGGRLALDAPAAARQRRPSTSRTRPSRCPTRRGRSGASTTTTRRSIAAWRRWLVEDQRFVDGRPDVATWVSEPLDGAAHRPRSRQGEARSPRRPAPTPTGWSS